MIAPDTGRCFWRQLNSKDTWENMEVPSNARHRMDDKIGGCGVKVYTKQKGSTCMFTLLDCYWGTSYWFIQPIQNELAFEKHGVPCGKGNDKAKYSLNIALIEWGSKGRTVGFESWLYYTDGRCKMVTLPLYCTPTNIRKHMTDVF